MPPTRSPLHAARCTLHSSAALAAISIALAALALRLWHLGRTNLWLDEIGSVALARKSLGVVLENVRQSPHGPAYYVLLKGWMGLFGSGEAGARGLSVVAGVAVVLAVYHVGTRLGGTRLGAVAALLTALSPVQLYFSQEARFHMVAAALPAAALAGYLSWRARAVRALEGDDAALTPRPRARDLFCLVLPIVLSLYTYALCALVVAALWVDAALLVLARGVPASRRRAVALSWLLLQGVAALVCVPLALGRDVSGALNATQVWRTALGARRAASDMLFYPTFQFQSRFLWPDDFGGAWEAYRNGPYRPLAAGEALLRTISLPVACVVVALCLAVALRRAWRSPWRAVWLAALVPLAAEAAISSRQSLELSRYALFVAPPLMVLVARGVVGLPRALGAAALAVLVATEAYGIAAYQRTRSRDTDYRAVAALLAREAHAGDSVLVAPWYAGPAVAYYVPTLQFEVREEYRGGWSASAFRGAPVTGVRWMIVDYRGGDFYHAPVDSLEGTAPFAGTGVRVAFDSVMPTSIRVLRLVPTPGVPSGGIPPKDPRPGRAP